MSYASTTIKKLRYLISRDSDQFLILEKNNGAFVTVALDTPAARDAAVNVAVTNLLAGVPGALDTLNELATALGDDPNFATTVTTALGNRLAWKGVWAPTTTYVVNDFVVYNGGLYRAPSGFTSAGAFNKANWLELVPQVGTYAVTPYADSIAANSRNRRARPKLGLDWDDAMLAFQAGRDALLAGTLATKKAIQTGKSIRIVNPTAVTHLTVPFYADLAVGIGDNDAMKADKGWLFSVDHVYDLTADAGRTTDLHDAANDHISGAFVSTTVTVDATHTYEIQGSYAPYQGLYGTLPPNFLLEVLDYETFITTDGTGSTNSYGTWEPLTPKLPMPTGLKDAYYTQGEIRRGAGATTETGASGRMLMWPDPPRARKFGAAYAPLARGAIIVSLSGNGQRGANQTSPQILMNLRALDVFPAVVNGVSYLAGYCALVRVTNLGADSSVMAPGQLFLLVGVKNNTTGLVSAGADSSAASACDLFALPNTANGQLPCYFGGMEMLP